MPWKENRTMDLRVQLIQDYNEGESIAALAEIYRVARKTIYKWLARHDAEGVAGVGDPRRGPRRFPGPPGGEEIAHHLAAPAPSDRGAPKIRGEGAAAAPPNSCPPASTNS